jgi:hypothetical protein
MEMILTVANVAGGIVAGVMSVTIWELLRVLAGRKVDVEVATLRGRLADVEEFRRQDLAAARKALKAAGCECQGWPHGQANDCPLHGDEDEMEFDAQPAELCLVCGSSSCDPDLDKPCPNAPPPMIRKHVGEPPFTRPVCDELEGDCS